MPTLAVAIVLAGAPTLSAHAEPPPLIPREVLMGTPIRENPAISPDGTRLAFTAPNESGTPNIWIQPLDGSADPDMLTSDENQGVWGFEWAHDGNHILYIQDREGDENWHLFAVDITTREVRDLTPYDGVRASNILTDPNHPDVVLVGLNLRDRRFTDMHRVILSTGDVTMEAEDPGDVTEWVTDNAFRIRAAVALDSGNSDTVIRVRDTGDAPWREIVRWPLPETGSVLYQKVLGFTPDGASLYVQSPQDSEMTRLVVMDADDGTVSRVLAEDPKMDIWNTWWVPQVVRHPTTHAIQAVGFCYLTPEWRVLDEAIREDFEVLSDQGNGRFFKVMGRDHADTLWMIQYYADISPDAYALYDRTTKTLTPLFESRPELAEYTLAPTRPVVIPSRDGLDLPSYLTLPVGVEPRNLPLVLVPHGGPWARDDWEFDPWVQLLANRGYAALQVNFRGSVGYGKSFINAATGEWGGAMQNDLTDAVQWLVQEGIADPERVGIMGASYGGYATLAGITFTPEVYRCAVAMVAPSNLRTLFESFPPYWGVRKKRWVWRVGPVETDPAFNERVSPLYHVERIEAPLLISHGANDPRVKLSESEAIVSAMQKKDLEVTFVVYPDEGHGLGRTPNLLDFMGRTEEFLQEHLGGRKEPWQKMPGTSAEVRVGGDPGAAP